MPIYNNERRSNGMNPKNIRSFHAEVHKTALGIDICKNAVSFALLHKKGPRIELVRAGSMPLEPSVVSDGIVQDPAALVRVLRHLKIAGPFTRSNTVLTLCAEPILLQILNPPDSSPGEVRKFIQNEIKQYAVLPLKNIEVDYCGLKSSGPGAKKVLVGAAKSEHLSAAINAIEKGSIDVNAVEPAVTAFIRICYNKVIKTAGEKNVMLLLVRDDTLNLCVFEKQRLEFLRTKKFEASLAVSDRQSDWLKDEIESVIRFYEIERETKAQGWQIIIASCPENNCSVQIAGEIRNLIARQDIEITAFNNSLTDVETDDNSLVPPVAAGAAMKLLDEGWSGIKLNLLPKEIISIKKSKKEMLIIANVAACLLVLLLVQNIFMSRKSMRVNRDICAAKQKYLMAKMVGLAESEREINMKTTLAASELDAISKAVDDKRWHNWGSLLAELADVTPRTILIKNLRKDNDNTVKIDGLAVSFEAVDSFIGLLQRSGQIASASIVSAGQDTKSGNGLVDYSIACSLRVKE